MNELLAAEFDGNPLIEWVDLMQYGFWGEGHTSDYPSPFPDYATAERTSRTMTAQQLSTWKKTPVAVNTQPDISNVGNRAVLDMAVRAGAWLRSDSIIVEEPIQIDQIANRPAWLAAILEDGYLRQYDVEKLKVDSAGINVLENYMLHAQTAGKLSGALDGIRQSCALQRKISARLRKTCARVSAIDCGLRGSGSASGMVLSRSLSASTTAVLPASRAFSGPICKVPMKKSNCAAHLIQDILMVGACARPHL